VHVGVLSATRGAAMKNRVLRSLENASTDRCVDVFVRPDGSFGFEEFRRDSEDCGRWQCLNAYALHTFASEEQAVAAARRYVPWLVRSGL